METYSTNPKDIDNIIKEDMPTKEKRIKFLYGIREGFLDGRCLVAGSHYALDEGKYEIIDTIRNINTNKPVTIFRTDYDDCYEYLYKNDYYMFYGPKIMAQIEERKKNKKPRIEIFEENLLD
ncbi:hypothetical protein F1B92_04330 [Campylobacter sp. FMV-PI01]|uniref:Uncharacterized protein n=1 Tax=Campylobacter portucalensis TaxID=2608384 RepID=A0A6L5WKN7_9BACT|nr:hypothetical protein [Campylobacter portucalensis]MSN96413.1 hypothetical protein [Campylobacter portucalensis]